MANRLWFLDDHNTPNVMNKSRPNGFTSFKFPLGMVSTYVRALFSHQEFLLYSNPPSLRSHIQDDMLIWSHRSNLTSSWTIQFLFYSIPSRIIMMCIQICVEYGKWKANTQLKSRKTRRYVQRPQVFAISRNILGQSQTISKE